MARLSKTSAQLACRPLLNISGLLFLALALLACGDTRSLAQPNTSYFSKRFVVFEKGAGRFPLSVDSVSVPIVVSPQDFPGVMHAAKQAASDIGMVTGSTPQVDQNVSESSEIIIGTIGRSTLVDELVKGPYW